MTYSEAKVELYAQLKRNFTEPEYGSCHLTTAIVSFDIYTISAACVRTYGDWCVNTSIKSDNGTSVDILEDAVKQIFTKSKLEELYQEYQEERKAAKEAEKQDAEDISL